MMISKRTVKSATVRPYIAIFELGLSFDHSMMPRKYRDAMIHLMVHDL